MYNARFEKSNGENFYFDIEHRIVFDLEPLSELDVDISTSQGVAQLGSTVENRSVGGVERDITGHIVGYANDIKNQMLSIFTPFSGGKLYFNDRYYCDCVVKRTPAIGSATRDVGFSISLYCDYPYWYAAGESYAALNTWAGCFRFPGPTSEVGTNYDLHCFGTKNENAFVNIYNAGSASVPFSVTMSTDSESVTGYGIVNVYTLEYFMLDDTLHGGETVNVYWDGARLRVTKTLSDGTTEDDFAALNEGSSLFYLEPGDNILRTFSESGETLSATVTYRTAYVGVYDGM